MHPSLGAAGGQYHTPLAPGEQVWTWDPAAGLIPGFSGVLRCRESPIGAGGYPHSCARVGGHGLQSCGDGCSKLVYKYLLHRPAHRKDLAQGGKSPELCCAGFLTVPKLGAQRSRAQAGTERDVQQR